MIDTVYFKQAELLLRIIPLIDREAVFALKGGTAINFFVRDLPRISADIRPVFEAEFREMTLEEVTCEDLEKTREELVSMISRELTIQEKQFIVSV
ncbi:MAG: nucleotidyl transferase AbiEii/AbiGii toxin family protein, partial [Syntrophales bacterium]|nr:nucleotidyl transferase AbiEii/AbiGii toxin family protein [Syntrophales bacterium]